MFPVLSSVYQITVCSGKYFNLSIGPVEHKLSKGLYETLHAAGTLSFSTLCCVISVDT